MNLVNEGVLPPDELDDRDERREEHERARSRETVADIVADIRERAENAMRNGERLVHNEAVANMLTFVADRIEAAAKRDEERAVEHATRHAEAVARDNCRDCVHNPSGKNYEGGNAAAMREALEKARGVIKAMGGYWARETLPIIDAALSKPARQCDVGTPEEQAQRFDNFCKSNASIINWSCSPKCPCIDCFNQYQCLCTWAQLPYKEGARK